MRQMNTPDNANPMMAPLDNTCGGAKPDNTTPVEINIIWEFVQIEVEIRAVN